ncbi:MAG: hypothetical protein HYW26_01580 [Candidatus Aenigmarchaeota archaeon]|nr:hypothetical protein [Candidatus Aenigmarchaeota archaeon]
MTRKIKIYVAGSITEPEEGAHDWRDSLCKKLTEKTGFEIINLDPSKYHDGSYFDDNNERFVVGRDAFMIKSADIVIVNLADDIGIGASQEMLIAKHFKKPLIGIAPKGGRFNRHEKKIMGKVFRDWIHPFVKLTCDKVAADADEAASFIVEFFSSGAKAKDISIIEEALKYYEKEHHPLDKYLHEE